MKKVKTVYRKSSNPKTHRQAHPRRLYKGYNTKSTIYIYACFTHAVCKEMDWDETFKFAKDWYDSAVEEGSIKKRKFD